MKFPVFISRVFQNYIFDSFRSNFFAHLISTLYHFKFNYFFLCLDHTAFTRLTLHSQSFAVSAILVFLERYSMMRLWSRRFAVRP